MRLLNYVLQDIISVTEWHAIILHCILLVKMIYTTLSYLYRRSYLKLRRRQPAIWCPY